MDQRIIELNTLAQKQDLLPPCVEATYDPLDLALPEAVFNAKRVIDYILAQPVYITQSNRFTGMLRFSKVTVPAELFHRSGHKWFGEAQKQFYCKHLENLVVFEWQHSAPDYDKILKEGIEGILRDIAFYQEKYRFDHEKYDFETALEVVCRGIVAWSEKCAAAHEQAASEEADPVRRQELLRLAETCRRVPLHRAESFYEGVQTVICCFQFLPDSIGTLDRYLYGLYEQDMQSGRLTRDEAKSYLQELFIHIANHTSPQSMHADNSAECHFAVGGYTERGEDGFNDLSRLIVEALMELDIRRPEISLRWTKKTPFEILRFMLDAERNDKNKRIAFVNDEPRIPAFMAHFGMNFSEAARYTMVGCNEPSFPGTLWKGGLKINIVHSLTQVLFEQKEAALACNTFEEFWDLYRKSLAADVERTLWYQAKFDAMRSRDCSVLSSFMLNGCIENGLPANRGGCKHKIGGFDLMGLTCLIDSLAVIRQYVFEEKKVSFADLLEALSHDWQGYEDLHTDILKNARFFGNNDELSDSVARLVNHEMYTLTKDRRLADGGGILLGTLTGYVPHYAYFGALTPATPDGRYRGEAFMVGSGQARGKDRNGLAALFSSVAGWDPDGILCGANVCNVMIEETVIRDDQQFEKFCRMVEAFFNMGGVQLQLNYVSKQQLKQAREDPARYGALKVRVSGYSASYGTLEEKIQDEIYARTVER